MGRHFVLLAFASVVITLCYGQCTFPSAVQGVWLIDNYSNITITNTTLTNFPIADATTATLDCYLSDGNQYVAKSTTTISSFYAYVCLDFVEVTSSLYYFYIASSLYNGYQTQFKPTWSTPTQADVCTLSTSQYYAARFHVMIKDGDAASTQQDCPAMLDALWSYEVDDGTSTTCTTNSGQLDSCTDQQLSLDYTACSTPLFYSSTGVVHCMASVVSGTTTYLSVYNTDTTVDNTNTFRFTCLAMAQNNDNVSMTQYPGACETTQTPTTVTTPTGSKIIFHSNQACPTPPVTDYTPLYIALGVIGGLLALFFLIVVFVLFLTHKAKQKPQRGRLEPTKHANTRLQLPRLNGIENGFKPSKEKESTAKTSPNGVNPENQGEEEVPINLMQLLRKDVLTPGGRESPSSVVMLSITTPDPLSHSTGDSDSLAGGLPSRAEVAQPKKRYHVISGEPSISEEGKGGYVDAVSRQPVTPRTPVMVLPVQAEGSDRFEGDDDDSDVGDGGRLFEVDGQSSLAAGRTGVAMPEPLCPPSRLPPIDEGPAFHRSLTGCGNVLGRRDSGHNASIQEEDLSWGDLNQDLDALPNIPTGRRSALGLLYRMEGNKMVAVSDLVDHVDLGSYPVGNKSGESKLSSAGKGRKTEGVRLKPLVRTASGRRGSAGNLKALTTVPDPKKKTGSGRGKGDRGKHDMLVPDDEDFKPKGRVKVTRVDIPELLPPGELEARAPSANELLDSPRHAFHNAGFEPETQPGSDTSTPRRQWLQTPQPAPEVWARVSSLWKLTNPWPNTNNT